MLKLLCILLILVRSEITEENDVLVLTDANIDEALVQHPQLLIEFYASWCTFCQKFAPMYSRAATRLKQENPAIRIAKLECTANIESQLKFHIEGYPTLKFFVNGSPTEYTGSKNEEGIVKWLHKKIGPTLKILNTSENIRENIEKHEIAVILFTNNQEIKSIFEKVAKNSEDDFFYVCENSESFHEFEVSDPGLVVFKHNDMKLNAFAGSFTEPEILRFLEISLAPWIMPFDEKAVQLVFGKQIPCLFIFRSDIDSEIYSKLLQNTANFLRGSILISYADLNSPSNKRLTEFLGFPSSWMPFALIVNQKQQKFVHKSEITKESLIEFVEKWKKGSIKPYLKSQSVPAVAYENGVRVLVGENFSEVVFDRNIDVLVKFYAPWCGHCKRLAPDYVKLANKFKGIDSILIVKIDATENEIEGFDIQEFPTLKFFPANNKDGIDYTGKKDASSLEEFVRSNAALPIKRVDL